ncbi:MAG TPA: HAD family hydrolase [Methylomusa anaerophila]|uniref:D,D-heptose 1,7-bisphosphate phosphatase n=1 Tax=Methylomusa anaerophila TaxID=1930071 RepID=A0A348AKL2_9FIRM|nr:HAD family hydrolase [Methylomusa anaerophila]BBB91610.1 D-glycero-beta-D-manno-heptose-1,7-bisphosphate 7-phosphatase [Methylomusa anaerophila]HML89452.1 HAD family hydrolase [Methylomusa anaerophila]
MTQKKPAVFFDRDGVLNIDHGYVHRREDFAWMPGAIEAVKWCKDNGWLVFVITNQSGVARGFYTEQHVRDLHACMNRELKQHGTAIDAFYYCPHHISGVVEEYCVSCNCRKPGPGMIQQAIEEWPVDAGRSILIGDKASDVAAAQAAGIQGYLFPGGNLLKFVKAIITSQLKVGKCL